MQAFKPHTLYVVATPLGNLDELSPRAAAALKAATHLYAEDTRVAKRLLLHTGSHARVFRADERTLFKQVPHILETLTNTEEVVAFVSDAGMPAISDPGEALVDQALAQGIAVEVVSGPVAAINALVASGLDASRFTFVGFLPKKQLAKEKVIAQLMQEGRTFILYESPKRVLDTLATLAHIAPTARVALARELTKLHEEVIRQVADELLQTLQKRPELKGECVLVVEPPRLSQDASALPEAAHALAENLATALVAANIKTATAAKIVAQTTNLSRDAAYNLVLSKTKK